VSQLHRNRLRFIPIVLVIACVAMFAAPAGAKATPVTHTVSYSVFYTGSTADGTVDAPCTSNGCANGIRYTWAQGNCYHGDRYPPVELLWLVNGKVATTEWPLNAPCSTGFAFTWGPKNSLTGAEWLGAGSAGKEGLAVCFQSKTQCNAGHCVTAGCMPAKTTGVALFFQTGDEPTGGEWTFKGTADGALTITGSPNDVFWYGGRPPSSPFANGPGASGPSPTDTMFGRTSEDKPQSKSDSPPSNANGVHMTWYLPKYESGASQGCHKVNGVYWTSPPLAFAYTTNGALAQRVTVPQCPLDSSNQPMTMNDIDFTWTTGPLSVQLNSADPSYFINANQGCQKKYTGTDNGPAGLQPSNYPSGTIPQPPSGTNGMIFNYAHDDFKANCWSHNGTTIRPPASTPGHPRYSWLH
jgi:hypothetical protein